MDPVVAGLLAVGTVVLACLWCGANRRHNARRAGVADEWSGGDGGTRLWTTAARCLTCAHSGGLVEVVGDGLRFTCMACGERHHRTDRA